MLGASANQIGCAGAVVVALDWSATIPRPLTLASMTVRALAPSLRYRIPIAANRGDVAIPNDSWIRLRAVVRWSTREAGRFSLSVDGRQEPLLAAIGPNMHNAFCHLLKIGNYRMGIDGHYRSEMDVTSCVSIGELKCDICRRACGRAKKGFRHGSESCEVTRGDAPGPHH
jgi:hypothetical protein